MSARLACGLALALLLGLAACKTVGPWEKDQLGEPLMRMDTDGAAVPFVQHAIITNEEAEGGDGGAGGGCGCR